MATVSIRHAWNNVFPSEPGKYWNGDGFLPKTIRMPGGAEQWDILLWERKYRFETTKSFQYPTFCEHDGFVWLCVTQGDSSPSRKERIMFGQLEQLGDFESQQGNTR